MKTKTMGKWTFHYHDEVVAIQDDDVQKIIFLPKIYDDIHLVVEVFDGELYFQPRWNIQFTEIAENEFDIITDDQNEDIEVNAINKEPNLQTIQFDKWQIDYSKKLSCAEDSYKNKLIFTNNDYDEIHLVSTIENNQLFFEPLSGTSIRKLSYYHYVVNVNFT